MGERDERITTEGTAKEADRSQWQWLPSSKRNRNNRVGSSLCSLGQTLWKCSEQKGFKLCLDVKHPSGSLRHAPPFQTHLEVQQLCGDTMRYLSMPEPPLKKTVYEQIFLTSKWCWLSPGNIAHSKCKSSWQTPSPLPSVFWSFLKSLCTLKLKNQQMLKGSQML